MIPVKANFKTLHYNNLECQTCDDQTVEDENHILRCENIKTEESVKIEFEDVFGPIEKQLHAVKVFRNVIRRRKTFLELKNN